MISNAAGYGGGSLMLCIFIVLFEYQSYDAIPLSKATICAGTLLNYFLMMRKRHPLSNRAMIDYTTCVILVPLLLLGTVFGVLLNIVFPSLIILSVLAIFFVFNTFGMMKRSILLYRKETEERNGALKLDQKLTTDGAYSEAKKSESTLAEFDDSALEAKSEIRERYEKEFSSRFPPLKMFLISLNFVYVLTLSFLRGGEGFDSVIGLDRCGIPSWTLIMLTIPICLVILKLARRQVEREEFFLSRGTILANDPTYFRWDGTNSKNVIKYSILSFIGGLGSGMLGIGGGPIMVPLLLDMGLLPEAASATSSFTVLMTATSTSLQYFVNGDYKIRDSTLLLISSVVGSLIGNIVISALMRKYKRSSILLIVLTIASAVSTFVLPTFGIYKIIYDSSERSRLFHFNTPCQAYVYACSLVLRILLFVIVRESQNLSLIHI
eukprot:TRINITY_DN684_c0_g1_i2.p1 TRINITY_DN684_c0_g1~~TRINITY_DN684_c0_g1_i2.p1  ORF type:complete len:437 (+),score=21.07 TRINITY_DN684_c0_g1_i2:352-1662(+)